MLIEEESKPFYDIVLSEEFTIINEHSEHNPQMNIIENNISIHILPKEKQRITIDLGINFSILKKKEKAYENTIQKCDIMMIERIQKNDSLEIDYLDRLFIINMNKTYEETGKDEKIEIKELKKKLRYYEKYTNNNYTLMEIAELNKEIKIKNEEIKQLKKVLPFEINKGDKIITLIFTTTDQKFYLSIICKISDIFTNLINKVMKEYPEYKEKAIYFMCNGAMIQEYKTVEENNLKNSNIILIHNQNDLSLSNILI